MDIQKFLDLFEPILDEETLRQANGGGAHDYTSGSGRPPGGGHYNSGNRQAGGSEDTDDYADRRGGDGRDRGRCGGETTNAVDEIFIPPYDRAMIRAGFNFGTTTTIAAVTDTTIDDTVDIHSTTTVAAAGGTVDVHAAEPVSDSEQFLEEYVFPSLEHLKADFIENDNHALDIYRRAGLDEYKVRWRNFNLDSIPVGTIPGLNHFQKLWMKLSVGRRMKKIAFEQERLVDAQIHFIVLALVIYKHRPDLKGKYGKLEMLTLEGR